MFCVVCNKEHKICTFCTEKQSSYIRFSEKLTTNKLTENIVLQCCDNCHITEQDKEMNSCSSKKYITYCWKNKYLLDNPHQIIYPSWIKKVLPILLLIMKRSIDNKGNSVNFLPKEIWIKIFKSINLNQIGRINPNHSSLFMENYNKSGKITYCDLCKEFHYLDEGNILTVMEKYKDNPSMLYKIVFVMFYSTPNKYFYYNIISRFNKHLDRVKIDIYKIKNKIVQEYIKKNNYFELALNGELPILMKQYREDIVEYINN
jgi:hypothetical protein